MKALLKNMIKKVKQPKRFKIEFKVKDDASHEKADYIKIIYTNNVEKVKTIASGKDNDLLKTVYYQFDYDKKYYDKIELTDIVSL